MPWEIIVKEKKKLNGAIFHQIIFLQFSGITIVAVKQKLNRIFLSIAILVFTHNWSAFAAVYVDVVMKDLTAIWTLQRHLISVGFHFTTARTAVLHDVLFHWIPMQIYKKNLSQIFIKKADLFAIFHRKSYVSVIN